MLLALLFIVMFINIFIIAAIKLVVREMIMIIISKECFSIFNGSVLAELDKPNEFERSLAFDDCFSYASQQTKSHAKKKVGCFSCPLRNAYSY